MPRTRIGRRDTSSSMSTTSPCKGSADTGRMAGTPERRRPETNGSVGLLQTLETSLDDIRTLITCRVCIRPLFEPYTIECGHTFCYGCLSRWFERDRVKRTCPDCRADVLRAPAPAYLVRDMTQIFAKRAELMPMGETTDEHKKWQEEEAALVERDRLAAGPSGGLFRGCFRRGMGRRFPGDYMARQPIRDLQDGVDRCPRCTWELEDGVCQSCGYPSEGDELSDSDAPEYYHSPNIYGVGDDMDVRAALDAFEYEGQLHHFDSEYSPVPYSEEGYTSEGSGYAPPVNDFERVGRYGLPVFPGPHHDEPGTPYDSAREATDEGSEDDDTGSLDDFVVDEEEERRHSPSGSVRSLQWETDNETEAENMPTQISDDEDEIEAGNIANDGDVSFSTGPNDQWDTEEDSDQGPIPPSRRQLAQRVITLNASSSEDEIRPAAPNRRHRHQTTAQGRTNATLQSQRYVPHHPRTAHIDKERPHSVPIEIDSDSDAPMSASQARRTRRTQRPSPFKEDSDAEGSSGTATVGRLSPNPPPIRRISNEPEAHDRNESSPVIAGSNLGRSTADQDRTMNETHWGPQSSASADHGSHNPPQNNTRLGLPQFSSAILRRHQAHQRLSPRPSPSRRHSPAPGPARSTTSEEQQAQGLRDRQARKADRKAERRRLKAERERRRSGETTDSASPLRQSTNGS